MLKAAVTHHVEFNIVSHLKERTAQENFEDLGDDLFSLSPLTSPEPSPTSTPTVKTTELPVEISSPSQAAEPLSTAQARLKRRRVNQGRKNRAKRHCNAKQKERDGPPIRAEAEEKYAANSAPVFTPASTMESNVASTGYVGLNRCTKVREDSLKELRDMGFDILKWDGR
jgi:hypothetical protein